MPRVVPWKLLCFIFLFLLHYLFSISSIFTVTNNFPYIISTGTLAGAGRHAATSDHWIPAVKLTFLFRGGRVEYEQGLVAHLMH